MSERVPEIWYPASICAWEMKHSIVRQEANGILYISAPDFLGTCETIWREKAAQARTSEAENYTNKSDGG